MATPRRRGYDPYQKATGKNTGAANRSKAERISGIGSTKETRQKFDR